MAGAAAILAGEHPDWTGAQLKDALIGSVKRLDIDTFAQGAGRLDVATDSAGNSVTETVIRAYALR